MKKYLMSGIAVIAFAAAFTSCSKSTDLYDQAAVDEKNKQEQEQKLQDKIDLAKANYKAAFTNAFGNIQNGHTWGFGSAKASTRAGGDPTANVEGKFWAKPTSDGLNLVVPGKLTEAQKDKVRRYFQQHQFPGGTECEAMTDYFVQHVYTGTTKVDNASLTTEKYIDGNLSLQPCCNYMNKLGVGSMHLHVNDYNATTSSTRDVWDGVTYKDGYTPTGDMSRDFNFAYLYQDQIMLMQNVDTQSFGYHNSMASNEDYNHYRLVSGDVIQAWDNSTIATNGESADVSGMLFVGFDFEGRIDNGVTINTDGNGNKYFDGNLNMYGFREATSDDPAEKVAYMKNHVGGDNKQYVLGCADGYYSDWIVRITKAVTRKTVKEEGRIICEDLGTSDDFDFNDVVFDATIYTDGTCDIEILAAGGILDISVAGQPIHPAVPTMTTKCSYKFSTSGYNSLNDIPVVVTVDAALATTYELAATPGDAPQKIRVAKTYKWCTERTNIEDAHPGFKEWVSDETKDAWMNNYVNGKVVE